MQRHSLTLGQCASLACLLEVSIPKPGNVHRGADFENVTFYHFAAAAGLIAPIIEAAPARRVGETILTAVASTRLAVATNTNLGTLMLMAPLAKVPREAPLATGVVRVLAELDATDARCVYEAIRLAQAGGLGRVDQADVADDPPADLLAAMRLAADRDLVARQYANNFAEVLSMVVPWLAGEMNQGRGLVQAVRTAQLRLLAEFPDSLIARKCGLAIAEQASALARAALAAGPPGEDAHEEIVAELDFWLRSDGHRRNPGTTADLLAAGLFAALRDGIIEMPLKF
ncbi:MAG: triphosphoribosyl-dephospho-CoA synthase [Pirellulales bacterium]|nr:triphosphoribosyl-dephospho-CoA synthase [Pirellulales bacterium]